MSNRYSNFPDSLDQLKLLPEVQELSVEMKQKIARYNELALKSSLTQEEELELQTLITETKDYQLNSSDWNKTNGVLMATQQYIKENILGDVGRLVDAGELQINNSVTSAKQSVTQTVTSGKNDINTTVTNAKASIETTKTEATNNINAVKTESMLQLNQKVADIVAKGNIGIDYFKGRTVLTQDSATVKVNINEFNRTTDFLIVFINGLIGIEGVNYTMDSDNFTIRAIGGSWQSGDEFDFVNLKRTVVLLDRYDAGLFEDGTIRKEKLTQGLQDEITNATSEIVAIKKDIVNQVLDITNKTNEKLLLKQDKEDNTLKTTNKTIVGGINELKDGKINLSEKGVANGVATLAENGLLTENQLHKIGDIKPALFPPSSNWLKLDGSQISRNDYQELYDLFYRYYKDLIRNPKAITGLGVNATHQSGFPSPAPYNIYAKNNSIIYTLSDYHSSSFNDYRRQTFVGSYPIESYEAGVEKPSPYKFLYALNKWWAVNEVGVKTNDTVAKYISYWTDVVVTKNAPLYKMYNFNGNLLISTKIYTESSQKKFQIIKSTNGTTWETKTFSFSDTDLQEYISYYAKIVGYINNRYIVIIDKKIYSISSDFATLTLLKSSTTNELFAYENTKDAIYYVDGGTVYKSVDGISFTNLGNQVRTLSKVVHTGNSFVGMYGNTLYLSDDGVNFDKSIELFTDNLDWVAFYTRDFCFNEDTSELIIGIEIYAMSGSYNTETLYKVRFNPDGTFNLPIHEESTYIKAR